MSRAKLEPTAGLEPATCHLQGRPEITTCVGTRPRAAVGSGLSQGNRQANLDEYDGEERTMFIGADQSGRLLEIVVVQANTGPRIIHADQLRPKFYDYL
jgi:hypothetical protein